MASDGKNHVNVFVRIKPTDNFAKDAIELLPNTTSLNVHTQKEKNRGYINNQVLDWHFTTDGVLHNASQEEVYAKCASNLVKLTLDGYNNTLFAYGQTGSGKTYTMTGTTGNFQHRGIIPRAISQLYKDIDDRPEFDISVRISYLEIYKDSISDLLNTLRGENTVNNTNLTITEDDQGMTYVKGLACHVAKNEEEALNLLFEGETNRTVSAHMLNKRSSRSHCIFTIYCESHSRTQSDTRYTTSKFNFVDLAGSERLAKSQSEGKTEEEARYINKSLTFLEQTVIALEDKRRSHVPYRQNTLTHLLKDSLGGKCSTVMIGNIWGEESQFEETLSTLRFASRVMNIPSTPALNNYHNPILLCKQYEKEISILRRELAMYDTLTNRNQINYEALSDVQIKDVQQQVRRYVENDITDIEIVNLRQVKEVFSQFKDVIIDLETELETRSKEPVAVIKVSEPTSKAAEKVPHVPLKGTLVGEADGSSFNVGKSNKLVAQPSAIATARKKKGKRRDSILDVDPKQTRPISDTRQTPSNLGIVTEQLVADAETGQIILSDKPNTPPSKQVAFDLYKAEQGNELSQLFQENKEILYNKKKEAKEVSININKIKKEMDDKKVKLDKINEVKEKEDSIGENFLDEEEFELITSLKSLKNSYRTNYEYLQNIRSDFAYCENMVKLSREKLLSEFESWYNDVFHISTPSSKFTEKSEKSDKSTRSLPKDEGEKFENVQKEVLLEFPESLAFYNARISTNRRKLYNRSLKDGSGLPTINAKLPTSLVAN